MKTTSSSNHPSGNQADFGRRLNQIRAEGRARSEAQRLQRSTAEVLRSERLMSAFAFLGRIEELSLECLTQLATELPGSPKVFHRVYDGRYMVVLQHDEVPANGQGREGRHHSRVAFLLEPQHEAGTFTVECRTTVRDRDMEGALLVVEMGDPQARDRIAALMETCALAFAQRYFEGGAPARVATSSERPASAWLSDAFGT